MDYANLVQHVREKYNAHKNPTIAFGGSYGGELATWLRMKFPSVVQVAINSGGPILLHKGSPDTTDLLYDQWEYQIYNHMGQMEGDKKCGDFLHEGMDQLLFLKE